MNEALITIKNKRLVFMICLLFTVGVTAQQHIVNGVVFDPEGIPLPGVSILVKGTDKGTQTNFSGEYEIDIVDPDAILVFSYIGFQNQEISVDGQIALNLTLQTNLESLDEVVVVGYGKQEKKTLTGSVAQVQGDELTKAPVSTISESLVGKLAGVTTRQGDGRPGNSTALQIRNMGAPLFVIDGVPQDGGQFNNLNPGDIESISVLKDASAAIYGVRASNGVVLVTTKSGRKNQENQINIHTYYGWQSLTRFPQPARAADYVRASAEADINLDGTSNWTPEDVALWQEGTQEGYRGYDWSNYIRKNVPRKFIQASTSGGSERISYYSSISYVDQDAVFDGYNFNRINLQSNIKADITDRLKVGVRINGKIESREFPGVIGGDKYWQPLWGAFRNLPTERPYANDNPNYPNTTTTITTNNATFDHAGYEESKWRSLQTNIDLEYDMPIEGLKVIALYSHFFNNMLQDKFEYSFDTYTYNKEEDSYDVTGGKENRYRSRRNRHIRNNVLRLLVNYDTDFGDHKIKVMAGGEAENHLDKNFEIIAAPSTNYIDLIREFNELQNVNDNIFESARAGFFGRINYDYNEKYLIEIAARYDGSWRFPPNDRWGFFPSISIGWRITEEPFLQNSGITKVLNDFKLRASYGKMGQDEVGIGAFAYMSGYNYGDGNAVMDGELITGIAPRGMPVRTLSWIESSIANVGFDFRMWEGKLSGEVDGFYRKRTGLPGSRYDVLIPTEAALDLPPENLGADANMGIEGAFLHRNTVGDFTYSVGVNATLARRKNLYTYKPRFGNSWDQYRHSNEDRWAAVQWGQHVVGRFQSQEQIANYPVDIDGKNNTTVMPGDFIYEDVNDDGVINDLDSRPVGYGGEQLPYMTFGLNLETKYKGFDFSLAFAGGTMQSRGRGAETKIPFMGNGNSPEHLFNDRWHREDIFDPESNWIPGTYPALRRSQNAHINLPSDFWFRNVTYLRLRNIQIGYTLPKVVLDKLNVDQIRVYINGLNLYSFDNLKDLQLDPESNRPNGLDYPPMKVVNIGANIRL